MSGKLEVSATGPFLPLLTLTEKLDSPPVKWLIDRMSGK
jgi:hypothetical protein